MEIPEFVADMEINMMPVSDASPETMQIYPTKGIRKSD
jgi:hypothetical protein